MPTLTAYKVFKRTWSGELVSVIAEERACVTYDRSAINHAPEWLARQGYGPLVFGSLENAIGFHRAHAHQDRIWHDDITPMEVWLVEGEQIPLPKWRCDLFVPLNNGRFDIGGDYWWAVTEYWPEDSHMLRTVKLLKPIIVN